MWVDSLGNYLLTGDRDGVDVGSGILEVFFSIFSECARCGWVAAIWGGIPICRFQGGTWVLRIPRSGFRSLWLLDLSSFDCVIRVCEFSGF